VLRPDVSLNASFSQVMARPGHIALVSQSGALCTALLDWATPRNIGFSCVISSGTAADVDFGEILDYLVVDPATRAIMLYVEGIHDARRFMSAVRAASRAKPVVVMKAGRHAEAGQAAISHTGAMVGSDDVFDAAVSRAGVVRVHNYVDFFAVAETLHTGVRTRGPRLAILTNGGGPGVMAADFLADKRLPLARLAERTGEKLRAALPHAWSGANPVDVLGDADAGRYATALRLLLEDDGCDAVLAILAPQAMTDPEPVAEAVADIVRGTTKPVLTCWMGGSSMEASREMFRRRGVATYATPEAAVEAFTAVAAHRANQQMLLQVPRPLGRRQEPDREGARLIIDAALAEGRRVLDVIESKALLRAFDIPVLESVPAAGPREALTLGEQLGFPLVMKVHSADISHKSDVDGVRLGIANGAELGYAWRELMNAVGAAVPEARIQGVLLERMWRTRHGREIMLGVVNDPVFGPAITVGLGGTLVEVIRDRAVGLPPLNRFLVERMIEETRASRYLDEFRGKPAANRRALEDAILRLSDIVCELPWIEEIDINPLVVDENAAIALDARVVLREGRRSTREYGHMAIHPYPSNLMGKHVLADGTPIVIRPIRPEDAELEREFVNNLSERSRYLRFMYALQEITPAMVSRFTQIDYDREMALVALTDVAGNERQVGVARYVTYPGGRGCEFAIVVADEWEGRGLAKEMLRRLIGIARERGLEEMDGVVLRENRGMLALAKKLGFTRRASAEDPEIVYITLSL
jgi:acetyltransferase